MKIFTKEFWSYAGDRAIKTFAQTAIATIGTTAVGVTQLDWLGIVSVAATATIMSILTSIVALSSNTGE
jgi:hypothetical protein